MAPPAGIDPEFYQAAFPSGAPSVTTQAAAASASGTVPQGIDPGFYEAAFSPESPSTPSGASLTGNKYEQEIREVQAQMDQTAATDVSPGARFMHGLGNMEYGLGQLVEHTPVLSTIAHGYQEIAGLVQGLPPEETSADQFDQIVSQRENDYQKARTTAGQTGIDWWNLGGEAANPINYLGGGAGAFETAGARVAAGAATGAVISAAQPTVNSPGSFWWQKSKAAMGGAIAGGETAGLIETVTPILKGAVNLARARFGSNAPSGAADQAVNEALKSAQVDPNTVPIPVIASMKQQASDALSAGIEPNPAMIANRAKAESLPVPVHLTSGQASGDPMQFSKEMNLRGKVGVGEPITQLYQQQNSAFIQNLDALGAKGAPTTIDAGNFMESHIQKMWNDLNEQKNAAYSGVRNSQGQPALVDQYIAAQAIHDAMDNPQSSFEYDFLPQNIQKVIDNMEDGNGNLTVAQLQQLDKSWGAMAAGSSDGNVRNAIYKARDILNNAPIQDDLGQQSMAAYTAAKALHAKQMSMITPKLLNGNANPAYQPLVKMVVRDGVAPEQLFNKGILNASPGDITQNLSFLNSLNPNAKEFMGRTLMGEIKDQALNGSSDQRGTVSNAVLSKWTSPRTVNAAKVNVILPEPQAQTLKTLSDVVELAKRYPVSSTVNTSNTGTDIFNTGMNLMKGSVLGHIASKVPGIKGVTQAVGEHRTAQDVKNALNPGVSARPVNTVGPRQGKTNYFLSRMLLPGVVGTQANGHKSSSQTPQ